MLFRQRVHRLTVYTLFEDTSSIDLIVTSPPYNIKNSTGNGLKNGSGGKWPQAGLIKGYAAHDDAMPHDEYVSWQRRCLDEWTFPTP